LDLDTRVNSNGSVISKKGGGEMEPIPYRSSYITYLNIYLINSRVIFQHRLDM